MSTSDFHTSASLSALGVAVGVLLLGGCEGNPSALEHSDELEVELTIEPGHVHILQTEVTYTVDVHDHHGDPVTDFVSLEVQRLAEGSDTWRGTALELAGDQYVGTYMFSSSGSYQLRVAGQRPEDTELVVLHEVAEPLGVARAHAEAGGYRVEFETFPGHIHEGDPATTRVWVMEQERDANGVRPPIAGLDVAVHLVEEDGSVFHYSAHEHEAGEYEADHEFLTPGACQVGIQFTGANGQPAEAAFTMHIVHAH
jgi:hypothetical protein